MALVSAQAAVRREETALTLLSQAVGPLVGSSNLPLYQQLQRALRDAIDRRILGDDDALPPERDLAGEFGISRITVRKAIDGLVERRPAGAPPGLGHIRARASREEFLDADVLLGGHARARAHAAQ